MKRVRILPYQNPQGSVLVLSLVFIAVFAALAVALATVSGSNVQLADNYRRADMTRCSAESGLEVMRYWLSQVVLTSAPEDRFDELETKLLALPENLAGRLTREGATIRITDVPLLSSAGQRFTAVLTSIDVDNIELDITGQYGSLGRKVRSAFVLAQQADNVFDFGIATKGPLNLTGNVELEGYTIDVESNAYIDTDVQPALSMIGNCDVGGDVSIRNGDPDLHLQGNYTVGGEKGTNALKHIHKGVTPREFPEMNPAPFFSYATDPVHGHTLGPADSRSNASYENLHIPANSDPSFSGNMTLKGVIYIETPNVVSFSGNLKITGIIVTNGSQTDNSGDNQINFTGNVTCYPITQLPHETKFEGLHSQTGTFLLAPGFKASFGGNFGTLTGAIAANGLRFYGNAGGTVNGSIINYSDAPLEMTGNSDLRFNRSGLTERPAGFTSRTVLQYEPSSYCEPTL